MSSTHNSICSGTKIRLFSGVWVDLLDLQPNDILVEDIAHSLAYSCRWTGHTREFYSVAQHSVLCSNFPIHHADMNHVDDLGVMMGVDEAKRIRYIQFLRLMHDAGEAYYGDIATPLKSAQAGAGEEIRHSIDREIDYKYFGYYAPCKRTKEEIIKPADQKLLSMEAEWLMGFEIDPPAKYVGMRREYLGKPMERCWSPEEAEDRFLQRFGELNNGWQ